MAPHTKRVLAGLFGIVLTLGVASGCDSVKGVGNSTGDKIKQGGDAGGSTGYP
jgi:hypothetical protein